MINYLLKNRSARFLLYGMIALSLGFILSSSNHQLSNILFYISIFFLGYESAKHAIEDTVKYKKLNVDLLMILAAIGAILVDYASEGAVLLLIFVGAEVLEDYVTQKSTKAITELMSQVPDEATLILEDGKMEIVKTDNLKIDDIVLVSKGDQLPIDGYPDRKVLINEASLTGESVPVNKDQTTEVFAGTINEGDAFILKVSKEKKDTMFSGIIKLVEEAQNSNTKSESTIEKIETYYVPTVLFSVPIFISILYFFVGYEFRDAFYRGMVLLTVASPCALVAAASPAVLSAISNGAKNGILFKNSQALEILKDISYIATDKTGTLTYGEFIVTDYEVDEEILKNVVYIEQFSNHPIAKGIVSKFSNLDLSTVDKSLEVEEIAGSGVKMGDIFIGRPSSFKGYLDENGYLEREKGSQTSVIIGKGNEVVGYIELEDKIRESSSEAISNFHQNGVKVEMITGDNEKVAEKVAKELGLDNYIANCFPQDKINHIAELKQKEKVLMIGDGINDAPALALADIGVGMGSGTSAAMESSDLVIVKNDLNKVFYTYKMSQKLDTIIKQNVIFSVAVIILLIILNISGILDLPLGVVFHEGSTILVILNGLRMLYFNSK